MVSCAAPFLACFGGGGLLLQRTAFLTAAEEGDEHGTINAINAAGLHPDILKSTTFIQKKSALHLAAEKGHLQVLASILESLCCTATSGHNPDACISNTTDRRNSLQDGLDAATASGGRDAGPQIGRERSSGGSTIHTAGSAGAGVGLGATGGRRSSARQHTEEIAAPLDPYSTIRMLLNLRDAKGKTPLVLACGNGHLDCARYLLANGADRHVTDHRGNIALHYASLRGHLGVIFMLLSEHVSGSSEDLSGSVDTRNQWGQSPLHYAVWNKQAAAVQVLLQLGANMSVASSRACTEVVTSVALTTPLHLAAIRGHIEISRILLKSYVERVLTPAEAVRLEQTFTAADPRLQMNSMGLAAYQVAQRFGYFTLAMLLRPNIPIMRLFSNEEQQNGAQGPLALKAIAAEAMNRYLLAQLEAAGAGEDASGAAPAPSTSCITEAPLDPARRPSTAPGAVQVNTVLATATSVTAGQPTTPLLPSAEAANSAATSADSAAVTAASDVAAAESSCAGGSTLPVLDAARCHGDVNCNALEVSGSNSKPGEADTPGVASGPRAVAGTVLPDPGSQEAVTMSAGACLAQQATPTSRGCSSSNIGHVTRSSSNSAAQSPRQSGLVWLPSSPDEVAHRPAAASHSAFPAPDLYTLCNVPGLGHATLSETMCSIVEDTAWVGHRRSRSNASCLPQFGPSSVVAPEPVTATGPGMTVSMTPLNVARHPVTPLGQLQLGTVTGAVGVQQSGQPGPLQSPGRAQPLLMSMSSSGCGLPQAIIRPSLSGMPEGMAVNGQELSPFMVGQGLTGLTGMSPFFNYNSSLLMGPGMLPDCSGLGGGGAGCATAAGADGGVMLRGSGFGLGANGGGDYLRQHSERERERDVDAILFGGVRGLQLVHRRSSRGVVSLSGTPSMLAATASLTQTASLRDNPLYDNNTGPGSATALQTHGTSTALGGGPLLSTNASVGTLAALTAGHVPIHSVGSVGTTLMTPRSARVSINGVGMIVVNIRDAAMVGTDGEWGEEDECGVCLERRAGVGVLPCKHTLCGPCARRLCSMNKTNASHCPFCRTLISGFERV